MLSMPPDAKPSVNDRAQTKKIPQGVKDVLAEPDAGFKANSATEELHDTSDSHKRLPSPATLPLNPFLGLLRWGERNMHFTAAAGIK